MNKRFARTARLVTAGGVVLPVLGGRLIADVRTPIWFTFAVALVAFSAGFVVELLLQPHRSRLEERIGYVVMIGASTVASAYAVLVLAGLDPAESARNLSRALRPGTDAGPAPPFTHREGLFQAVAASASAICTVSSTGEVACWGEAAAGLPRAAAVVGGLPPASRVAVSSSAVCALGVGLDRAVRCLPFRGAFGDAATPRTVTLAAPAKEVALGATAGCVLEWGGAVSCFSPDAEAPTGHRIDGVREAVHVAVGRRSACVVQAGEVWCWDTENPAARADKIAGVPRAVDVAVGDDTVCAVGDDTSIHCWGSGFLPASVPTRVEGFSDVRRLSVGPRHLCASLASGHVRCKGKNDHGQLGLEHRNDVGFGVVQGLSGVDQLAVSELATCAISRDDPPDLACWGGR